MRPDKTGLSRFHIICLPRCRDYRGNRLTNQNLPATKDPRSRLSFLDLTGLGRVSNQSDRGVHARRLGNPKLIDDLGGSVGSD
jgi:hypothetical protein